MSQMLTDAAAHGLTVTIQPNAKGNPPGKLADAEIVFSTGPLAGMRLQGFSVWERRSGGRNVTFPARSYAVNGERRSFALLRPVATDTAHSIGAQANVRDLILDAYTRHENGPTQLPAQPTIAPPAIIQAPNTEQHASPATLF
jgi:hypothetical protein